MFTDCGLKSDELYENVTEKSKSSLDATMIGWMSSRDGVMAIEHDWVKDESGGDELDEILGV